MILFENYSFISDGNIGALQESQTKALSNDPNIHNTHTLKTWLVDCLT